MNKKTLSIVSFVGGVLTAVVALFFAIQGILTITGLVNDAKVNTYIIILTLLEFALAADLGIISYFVIKKFVDKNEETHNWFIYAFGGFLAFVFITVFVGMCFWGFNSARSWVILVLVVASCVLAILSLFFTFSGMINKILLLVSLSIGFAIVIVQLAGAGGFGIAVDVFTMFMIICFGIYYLFDLIISTETPKKDEPELIETKNDDLSIEEEKNVENDSSQN